MLNILKNAIKINVEQLENKNQYLITYQDKETNILCFQSYKTLIAIRSYKDKKLSVNYKYWDYSKTTMKHLKLFINTYTTYTYESKSQFQKLLLNDSNINYFE